MFDSLTEQSYRAQDLALEEAELLNSPQAGADHLLLGLLGVEGTVACLLNEAGITLSGARTRLEEPVRPDYSRGVMDPLELAVREAMSYGHDYVGTGHLLLGLVSARLADQSAVRLLVALGKEPLRVRRRATELIGGKDPERLAQPASVRAEAARLRRERREDGPYSPANRRQEPSATTLCRVIGIGLKQSRSELTVALTSLEIYERVGGMDHDITDGGVLSYLVSHDGLAMLPRLELEVRDRRGRRYEVAKFLGGSGAGGDARGSLLLGGPFGVGEPFGEEVGEITVEIQRVVEDSTRLDETPQVWEGSWVFHVSL